MRRIQGSGSFAARDPEDEKKKARQSVLSSLLVFTVIIGVIKTVPFLIKNS